MEFVSQFSADGGCLVGLFSAGGWCFADKMRVRWSISSLLGGLLQVNCDFEGPGGVCLTVFCM